MSSLQSKLLTDAGSAEGYAIYVAALEWDLIDPIVIESEDDVKSRSRWKDRVEPYHHQVTNLITFCRRLPVTLLADDVGLGKTISAGLIMSELIARSRLSRTLIVAPKLLGPQWKEELETKFDIPTMVATGRPLMDADPGDLGAVVTTYHSARQYIEKIPSDRFQMLILDEAHKLRNLFGVEKPPQVAVRFRNALQTQRFPLVLMLTATPIQNRLWDLYSLVELLTVARGHDNPFGSEGAFARKFILGDREKARQLKPEAAAEFRSIVYGYMSRVRRGDAKLHFPDRQVQLHRVEPTSTEHKLIAIVGRGIQKLNRLAQISILQALTSSPQALSAQLDNMERNRTIVPEFAAEVRGIVRPMTTSAKLQGLGVLIDRLKRERPDGWRLVVFTGRRETQTTIQLFLEDRGLSVGTINGSSGARNQETLKRFRADPPQLRVIVSTEAGSEGVNLQVANVLVNYDLPWNPMIVEQRIGRVQRLASKYTSVAIFNITLSGTFEDYIVGRLMEKLQMSTSTIGDIESLLEGAGFEDEGEDGDFEEQIRKLVVAALQGVDVTEIVRKATASIEQAKKTLEEETRNIDELMGAGEGVGYVGPRAPTLPPTKHSMSEKDFTLGALSMRGAAVEQTSSGAYIVMGLRGLTRIRFEADSGDRFSEVFKHGAPAFSRLVQETVASGSHRVKDLDVDVLAAACNLSKSWVEGFNGEYLSSECLGAKRFFSGTVMLRTRATVAHDSYERLVRVPVSLKDNAGADFLADSMTPLPASFPDPLTLLRVSPKLLQDAAERDPGVSEFCRFYTERRVKEIEAAGIDDRKRKKIEDDFTPRLMVTVVGAEGGIARAVRMRAAFEVEGHPYTDEVVVFPASGKILSVPPLQKCALSGSSFPISCLGTCSVTGSVALVHRLTKSEMSGRLAIPSCMTVCEASGKRVLENEIDVSSVTNRRLLRSLLVKSMMSGKLAEPEFCGECTFTGRRLLLDELASSDVSRKMFGRDEGCTSAVSSRLGHKSEFVTCHVTQSQIARDEAEKCDATGVFVRPGVLVTCEETGARVLESEISTSSVSGIRARKKLLVASSVSGDLLLEREAIASASHRRCKPSEVITCEWSGIPSHPDDLRQCELLSLPVRREFLTRSEPPRLEALQSLLDGTSHDRAFEARWSSFANSLKHVLENRNVRIVAATKAPLADRCAACGETKALLGLRVRFVGFLIDGSTATIRGRVRRGRRNPKGWVPDE